MFFTSISEELEDQTQCKSYAVIWIFEGLSQNKYVYRCKFYNQNSQWK